MSVAFDNPEIVQITQTDIGTLHLQRQLRREEAGQALLSFLTKQFSYHSKNLWLELIQDGAVSVNGVTGDATQILATGDLLTYQAVNFIEPKVPLYFEPILQTAELLLVGKPAGTPVTRTGLIIRHTFINLLRAHYGDGLHPQHRLDRETSGLLLCARGKEASRKYHNCETSLMTGKYYLAIVHGKITKATQCLVQPLATRLGSLVRCRMWPESNGKTCQTILHAIAVAEDFSLVLAELSTGRRHQIRAHLAHLGHPVVGDKIYGHDGHYYLKRLSGELSEEDYSKLGAHHHTLHAWAIRLNHADCPKQIYFSQLFSEDFRRYLALFPGWEKCARKKLTEIIG